MPIGTIAAILGALAAAGSTGYALSGAGMPSAPNLGASSAALANVEAELLPLQRMLQAAAQQGKSVTLNMPAHVEKQQFVRVPLDQGSIYNPSLGNLADWSMEGALPGGREIFGGLFGDDEGPKFKDVPYVQSEWEKGGKYYSPNAKLNIISKNVNVKAGPKTYDFTGLGQGEVQGKLAMANAEAKLALQQKYGADFIKAAQAEQQIAEPQQLAAHQKEFDLIQQQIKEPFHEPAADALDAQVQAEQKAAMAGKLDPQLADVLMKGVGTAAGDRGGAGPGGGGQFETPLTTGAAGRARTMASISKGMGELTSGSNPQDIAYRHEQQNLANLGAFANSQTPQTQFRSLTGAQQGAAPWSGASPLPAMPGNSAGAQGAAINSWQDQLRQAESQMNPWMAGVSGALGIGNVFAGMYGQGQQQNNWANLLASLQAGGGGGLGGGGGALSDPNFVGAGF